MKPLVVRSVTLHVSFLDYHFLSPTFIPAVDGCRHSIAAGTATGYHASVVKVRAGDLSDCNRRLTCWAWRLGGAFHGIPLFKRVLASRTLEVE